MAHLADHADLDGRIVMVKHRKNGFVVVLKVEEDDVERIKPRFTSELRSFANANEVSYITQKVKVRSSEFLAVQVVSDEVDEDEDEDEPATE